QKKSTADTTIYLVDDHAIGTFGTHLVAGRNFKPEEIKAVAFGDRLLPQVAIISKELANKLFPDSDPIGKQVFFDLDPPTTTIIGVVDRLQQPWMSSDSVENSTFVPAFMPYGNSTRYIVRAEPGRRDEVMKMVEQKMIEANPSRIIGKV